MAEESGPPKLKKNLLGTVAASLGSLSFDPKNPKAKPESRDLMPFAPPELGDSEGEQARVRGVLEAVEARRARRRKARNWRIIQVVCSLIIALVSLIVVSRALRSC